MINSKALDSVELTESIKLWGQSLGFQQIGISDIQLDQAEQRLQLWLESNYHGTMEYMKRHQSLRANPQQLVPDTLSVITARMDYLPEDKTIAIRLLDETDKAYISRYALGRDYHKLIRKRLQKLARLIQDSIDPFGYRVFSDSAPVLEKPLAEKSGLGWIGKHTNLINRHDGSFFFLGEIYTDLALKTDSPVSNHCGSCTACIDVCPTKAIVAPYQLDARRCISYLTIEFKGSIPVSLRKDIGNRIYGCDDCQLFCPWNRYANVTQENDFLPRHGLDQATLISLFEWDESTFLKRTEGMAIRRIGYQSWLRNIAIALGNSVTSDAVIDTLRKRLDNSSELVREHVNWALQQHATL
ncbi:MAG: tRNA epoxyqueuosine(34) reductase QueG [Gammaproteobacteria bacterium]|nr:tRNA epoxyqueuosine(34) reductase QueG [Gammaproteobacteria bacterium]